MSAQEELTLRRRVLELEAQLRESHEVLSAIYNREVDAVVVRGTAGDQVFTLEGADQPYRVIVETMAEGALTLAADGTVLHCNRAVAQLLDRPLAELIGSRFAAFVGDEHQERYAGLFQTPQEARRCDVELVRRNGVKIMARLSSSPLDLDDVPGAICLIVFDLTEHERAMALEVEQQAGRCREEFLRERQTELEHLNGKLAAANRRVMSLYAELSETARKLRHADEMKTRFLSNMSHEFRNPLNSIFALTSLLLSRADGELTGEQEKQVSYIRKAADSLLDLVNDLLDLAKIEAGRMEVRVGEFTAAGLFGMLRGMLPPSLVACAVELVFDAPDGIPVLLTDEGKVTQIVRNLIHNALKFTERGAVRVAARYDQENDLMVFSVSDTGIGIAADDQERVFDEFAQVEHPAQSRVKGAGLGLPLCRKLASLLGGRVELQSELGVGSTFSLVVPRRYLPPRPEEGGGATALHDPGDAAPLRGFVPSTVLIIDHDPSARSAMSSRLGGLDCIAHEAPDGAAGLRLARALKPDLVLLGFNSPAVSSREVLHLLKADPETRATPIAVVTSVNLTETERRELERQACAIIDKNALTPQRIARWISVGAGGRQAGEREENRTTTPSDMDAREEAPRKEGRVE